MLTHRSKLFKILSIGTPVVVSLYLAYRYFKSKQLATHNKQFEICDFDDQILQKYVSEIKERLTDKPLHTQQGLIDLIFRKSNELVKLQYPQLIQHYRRQRRLLTEPTQQVRSIIQWDTKLKIMKDASLNCILARLDIPEDVWSAEVITWLTPQRNQEWEALLADMEEELVSTLSIGKKAISQQNLHNIFRHHIKFLNQLDIEKYNLKSLRQEDVVGVINQLVSDELYKKFKLESEDIQNTLSNLSEEEYKQLQKHLDEITNLNTTFLIGNDENQS